MIRSGQMLAAEALQRVFFGSQFTFDPLKIPLCIKYQWFTSLFSEEMTNSNTRHLHPFSIQNLIETATKFNKPEGSWVGPGVIANVIAELFNCIPIGNNYQLIAVYVCEQGLNTIFMVWIDLLIIVHLFIN